ncbi:MAG TPA: hypothetical protein VKY73_02090 [Polyangiaceae bacterium]|nr:hypothetical protein [Polyangiaceae bacterium]
MADHDQDQHDPDYIPPSPEALDQLRRAIERAKTADPVDLGSFERHADAE